VPEPKQLKTINKFQLNRKGRSGVIVIPRALRHRDVAAQTRDRVEICLVTVPPLRRQRKPEAIALPVSAAA